MYAGKIVEEADTRALFDDPRHPYTRALLAAIPSDDPQAGRRLIALPGNVPDPAAPPTGCRFHPRCPERFAPCDRDEPADASVEGGRRVACHLHDRAVVR
jgi:oligopeptide/dipeptide ABC transporter ATP-binding protein